MWGSISTNSRMLNRNIDVPKYSDPSKISLRHPNIHKYGFRNFEESQNKSSRTMPIQLKHAVALSFDKSATSRGVVIGVHGVEMGRGPEGVPWILLLLAICKITLSSKVSSNVGTFSLHSPNFAIFFLLTSRKHS